MMWHISLDDAGRVLGFYPDDYQGQLPDTRFIDLETEQKQAVWEMMPAVYVEGEGFRRWTQPTPTLDELKTAKRATIAAARYEAETGGCTVEGVTVATDRGSQALLTAAVVMARLDPEFKTQWKCADGRFVALDAFQLRTIGDAVIAHVEACFAREGELCEQINAAQTPEELDAIQWSL